ncbi:type II secretion system protein [Solirubrobacter sp. CPCC 204708]|uniref:Type II secretion system GspH family protein n=1 Tax=Solirubrobacter deserti TaxID=2282478 RepID=A0ABT4RPM3_9ACTN|nr:type II secretion system protein [Solirubrobacter deserti]MBE2316611.1 type II secretion system protein [Solirubrobacter deserti]MDA0140509.1 type II secretion system GspH family protein [Solirubrobacter deserti]
MLHKLRARMQDEKGFTLIELLVVILIIGVLAAIALPAFLNQREKAQDSTAKSDVRTAQTAMETWYTDNQSYTDVTEAELKKIEPALNNAATLKIEAKGADGYTISVESKGSNVNTFKIVNAAGTVSRTCATKTGAVKGKGGCPTSGSW